MGKKLASDRKWFNKAFGKRVSFQLDIVVGLKVDNESSPEVALGFDHSGKLATRTFNHVL